MRNFFPSYLAYINKLLDKYSKFIIERKSTKIATVPIILEEIDNLRSKFKNLQLRKGLTDSDLFPRNLRSFRTLLLELVDLECFGLPIITHFNEEFDGHLNTIMHHICEEIGCPVEIPHVCALSTGTENQGRDYYWYHPQYSTIFVPAVEKFSLLNLPDLLHELGHHIIKIYRDSYTEQALNWFSEYNDYLEKKILLEGIQDQNRINESKDIFLKFWPDYWYEELICDLIAVYCVGQAYAWTNLKLCQTYPPDYNIDNVYYYSDFHPPDSYRMDGILAMLNYIGIACEDVKDTWLEYTQYFHNIKLPLYNYYFPKDLIDKMVEHVFQVCDDIGLISCSKNLQNKSSMISKLNNAWLLFRTNPRKLQEM